LVLGAIKNATVSILEVFERTKNFGEIFWSLAIDSFKSDVLIILSQVS